LTGVEVVSVAAHRKPTIFITHGPLLERLEARFDGELQLSDRLFTLTKNLEEHGLRYCVFGGWVRDTISEIQGMPVAGPPRDIDLVVRGIEVEGLLEKLPPDVRPTMFGGIQSNTGPVAFDIWPLKETFLIQYLGLAPTFESLLRSTDFNINAGLFFPRQGADIPEILDGGMLEALLGRTLMFNATSLPFPIMQCARLAVYAGKLSLNLDPAVQAFMLEIVADPIRREQVWLGLSQNCRPDVASRARQLLQGLIEEGQ
jgi:hypothetical protein